MTGNDRQWMKVQMRMWIVSIIVALIACGTPIQVTGQDDRTAVQRHVEIATDPSPPLVGQPTTLIVQVFAGEEQGATPTFVIRAFPLMVTQRISGASFTVVASTDIASGDLANPVYYAPAVFTLAGEWEISAKAFEGYPGNGQSVTVVDAVPTSTFEVGR
jgi:hypothetical protein